MTGISKHIFHSGLRFFDTEGVACLALPRVTTKYCVCQEDSWRRAWNWGRTGSEVPDLSFAARLRACGARLMTFVASLVAHCYLYNIDLEDHGFLIKQIRSAVVVATESWWTGPCPVVTIGSCAAARLVFIFVLVLADMAEPSWQGYVHHLQAAEIVMNLVVAKVVGTFTSTRRGEEQERRRKELLRILEPKLEVGGFKGFGAKSAGPRDRQTLADKTAHREMTAETSECRNVCVCRRCIDPLPLDRSTVRGRWRAQFASDAVPWREAAPPSGTTTYAIFFLYHWTSGPSLGYHRCYPNKRQICSIWHNLNERQRRVWRLLELPML